MLLGQQQEHGVGTAPLAWRPAERRVQAAGCPGKLEEESSFKVAIERVAAPQARARGASLRGKSGRE